MRIDQAVLDYRGAVYVERLESAKTGGRNSLGMDKNHIPIIDDLPAVLRDGLASQLYLLLNVVVYQITEKLLGLRMQDEVNPTSGSGRIEPPTSVSLISGGT